MLLILCCLIPASLSAGESYQLSIKDHQFKPTEISVKAGQKFTLVVRNEDPTPEEFEIKSLRREKVVAGNGQIILNLGPLNVGSYDFIGEFHEASAKGRIVAK